MITTILYGLLMVVLGWVAVKLTNWILNFNFRLHDE